MDARADGGARDDERATGGRGRSESYYKSSYNAPVGYVEGDASAGSRSPRWGLRGFVPPARFRVEGYEYQNAEDTAHGTTGRTLIKMRAIDAREMAYDEVEEDGRGALGVASDDVEAEARTTHAGGMSSRPSWTAAHYQGRVSASSCVLARRSR